MKMPQQGRDWDELRAEMIARGGRDVDWRGGKTAVYVFNAGEDIHHLQHEAYGLFMAENGLGPLAFPSLAQMEKEVIGMALGLLHAPEGAAGAMTSGGTDSITMAMKTARDFARASGKPLTDHNIVLPRSAHLAFDKAAHLMDIAVRRVPLKGDSSYEADPAAMAEAVDASTIMMVGSAPNFPHGIIDPIAALGEVAAAKGV
jgi:glutamate/tyrosine decarboxylase-like PLP-dependent enzyme